MSRPRHGLGTPRGAPADTARSDPGATTTTTTTAAIAKTNDALAPAGPSIASRRESNKLPTGIDARIIATLRQLNLARRAQAKGKALNFERIVLKFALARDAFNTMHAIYDQFASVRVGLYVRQVGFLRVTDKTSLCCML